ncbi:unnamed protein product [Rotaria magnacalcarata]|uniref:Uncharacterized protein n=1 Tax=Rotaria magnacalcarata TaxID=392030 RepID=A0A816WT03_9BILA|nr:unnamed protein product [Rotaria magnacalcarata]CAF1989491.1 unnamed protein product [Rotaria magnacalcarata]CAF2138132.1 unnamed protein product [Rotaria magnacalcarata]CAF2160300.1 unnamed protein product [Rotaria magnacalcarata]
MTTSNLQKLVGIKLISEMLRCDSVRQKERGDWKVLVMDRLATRIISASCKMHDIMSEGITIVEDIMKRREPLGMLEAVYFIQPNEKSVNELINDFDKSHALIPKYKAAHVFFTEACNSELFTKLTQSKCAKYIKTLREVNIAFLPYERQAFTLDSPDTFYITYNSTPVPQRAAHLDVIAEQIATLCATLGEYPTIRYRADNEKVTEFAHAVQQKLNQYKADDATMGEGVDKAKSILLLLDRGFDAVSPLLHELTFQAMAHDLLKIENDVFEYEVQTPGADQKLNPVQKQKVLLDENDELWTELRHQHIAVVTQSITKKIKDFAVQKRVKESDRTERTTMKDLSLMIKKMPQYQKELNAYALHFNIAEQCMNAYNRDSGEKLCSVEQNLVMGVDAEGERIKDHMRNIVPLLLDTAITVEDKLRIIMLYILHKNGITDENLNKLLSHAFIPSEKKNIITNLQYLNLQILQDQSRGGRRKNIPQLRKERSEPTYTNSRWTPYVKDILEDIIDDKLDSRQFPSIGGQKTLPIAPTLQSTREYPGWMQSRRGAIRSGPRIIVFILGGVAYNELRCAYEVTQSNLKKYEVFIGGDQILTPKQFLRNLEMKLRQDDEQLRLINTNFLLSSSKRLFHLTQPVGLKKITEKIEGNVITYEGEYIDDNEKNVLKLSGPEEVCIWCKLDRRSIHIQHTDVLVLRQYLRKDGTIIPPEISGLCPKQNEKLHTLIRHARMTGLISYPTVAVTKREPLLVDPTLRPEFERNNSYWEKYEVLQKRGHYLGP